MLGKVWRDGIVAVLAIVVLLVGLLELAMFDLVVLVGLLELAMFDLVVLVGLLDLAGSI
jgi:hypothetical protein